MRRPNSESDFMTSIKCVPVLQSSCLFGIARVDITPPPGIYHRMWGAATHDRAIGVHRPLLATAIALAPLKGTDPDTTQVLIALDHCLFGKAEMDALLSAVSSQTDVASNRLLVVFSHTHAAGLIGLDRVSLPGGELIPAYLETLYRRVADVVQQAVEGLQTATITYGTGRCNLAAHRDYWDDQSKQFVCGFNPGAPADDTVLVARVNSHDGRVLATLVNYACHPTTLAWENQLISPDYPGAMRELVEEQTRAPCVFLQGASGELGPRDGYVGDTSVADRNGRQLGFAALSALTALPPRDTQFEYAGPVVSGATLGTWRHAPLSAESAQQKAVWNIYRPRIQLPYREGLPSLGQAQTEHDDWSEKEATAVATGDAPTARDCRAMVERKTRLLYRLKLLPGGTNYPYEVSLWRLGDAIWIGLPGEPYNLIQRALRARHPHRAIVVMALAGGWGPSYLPTQEVYGTNIYQESIAVVEPGSLERIVDEVSVAMESL